MKAPIRIVFTWALFVVGFLITGGAIADSISSGGTLYANQCASCHGPSPLTSNFSSIYNGRNARALIDSAIAGNVGGMGGLRSSFPTGGSALADVAAYLGNSPASLTFGSTSVGVTSSAQTVTVRSSLRFGYSLTGLSATATGDFGVSGGTCGTTLGTGLSCTFTVTFTPTATGGRSGSLSIRHNNTLTPILISLSGTATGSGSPVATLAPSALSFSTTAIGTTSQSQSVTVSNSGTSALTLSAFNLSNSVDFSVAGGTCTSGSSLVPNASCTLLVAFKPTGGVAGSRSGLLSVVSNGSTSPNQVTLSGIAGAAAVPAASITSALSFGNVTVGAASATQTATLSNSGNAPLVLSTIATSSTEFGVTSGSCSTSLPLAAGSSCTVNVAFSPNAAGARSGTLTVSHNASGGQSSTLLSGTGLALTPIVSLSPTTLTFSQTVNTTSAAQTVTLSNTGNAALTLGSIDLAGSQAADFQVLTGSSCSAGLSLAPNTSCVVRVSFNPSAPGSRSANLSIASNASGSPSTVTLNGTGTAAPQASISLNATALTFLSQVVGTSSIPQVITLTNSGNATLNISGIQITGTAAGDFLRSGSCGISSALAPGATCSIGIVFTPGAQGSRTSTLNILSDASNGAAAVTLTGSGAPVPSPAVSGSPGAVDFGPQTLGIASTPRLVTLTNTGSGPLSIASISINVSGSPSGSTAGSITSSSNCPSNLAAGANCTITLIFQPLVAGNYAANLLVGSNAPGSPNVVSINGSGVVGVPTLNWSPTTSAVAFADQTVGAQPITQTLLLINQGPGPATLQQITISGANATDFSVSNAGSCVVGAVLTQSATCNLALLFSPSAVGARTATLQVVTTGSNPPSIALSGTGSAPAAPTLSVTPVAISLIAPAGSLQAPTQKLSLRNSGNAVLRIRSALVTSGQFSLSPAAVGGCAASPFDLLPSMGCDLVVTWLSAATGTETGSIAIDTDATASPQVIVVSAVREVAPANSGTGSTPSNVGAGGCTIAEGSNPIDPTLWVLVMLAGVISIRSRIRR